MKHTRTVMMELLRQTRENQYDFEGKYKGINLNESGFLEELNNHSPQMENDELAYVKDHYALSTLKPILTGGFTMEDFQSSKVLETQHEFTNEIFDFSLCSHTEYQMSQTVKDLKSNIETKIANQDESENYQIAYPGFKAALDMCKTRKDAKELSDYLHSFVFKLTVRKGNKSMQDNGVSFFGEDLSNRYDSFDRHKFGYEKRRKISKGS